ncbi:MAG: hypothetical protein OSJ58_10065 [Dysosmobacter sp.]|nr:hypothetical protein [Dysosmobacter sp.]
MELLKLTLGQIRFMLNRKGSYLTFLALLAIMLFNYVSNTITFAGYDVLSMYHPMKMLSLSYNKIYHNADVTLILVQLFPLIVNLPAGLSLSTEQQIGIEPIVIARIGRKKYLYAKLFATFVTTAIVFSTPFLIEILLNCIAFPLSAAGDFQNLNIYQTDLVDSINNYLFPRLYQFSPYIYAICGTVCFGFFAGLLAGFTFSISLVFRVKYRVVLLLPTFLLLHASVSLFGTTFGRWFDFVLLFNDATKQFTFASISAVLLAIITVIAVAYASRKDYLA